ncbi:MAG: hypothetical protein KKG10_11830 [Proteobacteria bacterium]|nr:hypothetical protein [Pseudomonadota bacterium]
MAEILDLEDRMIDFMNPWYDLELLAFMKERGLWYPVAEIEPVKSYKAAGSGAFIGLLNNVASIRHF